MGRYLVISSQVAHGHIGLSAIMPALQMLGHEVIALPTILLSNHPGHAKVAGVHIDPAVLGQMLDALEINGRLENLDGVLTGYLPTVAHVRFAADAVRRVWSTMPNREGSYFCDPVLGDDPKGLYVGADVAGALKELLLPLAHTLSPNRFELAWLSGREVRDAISAIEAVRTFGPEKFVYATSIPGGPNELLTLETHVSDTGTLDGKFCRVKRRNHVPNGTGDLLSGLLLTPLTLGQAIGCVEAAIEVSAGFDELQLIGTAATWLNAAPAAELPIEALS